MSVEQVQILINKATHPNTPIEEARSCALIACKLIVKYNLLQQNNEKEESSIEFPNSYNDNLNVPDFGKVSNNEVELFKLILSTTSGICSKCRQSFNKGEPVARGIKISAVVHYKCRRYFIGE